MAVLLAQFGESPFSDKTAGHGTHTLAAVWKNYLVELLRQSEHP